MCVQHSVGFLVLKMHRKGIILSDSNEVFWQIVRSKKKEGSKVIELYMFVGLWKWLPWFQLCLVWHNGISMTKTMICMWSCPCSNWKMFCIEKLLIFWLLSIHYWLLNSFALNGTVRAFCRYNITCGMEWTINLCRLVVPRIYLQGGFK